MEKPQSEKHVWFCISENYDEWLSFCDPTKDANVQPSDILEVSLWRRTTHAWAKKHKPVTLWLSAYCGRGCQTEAYDVMFAMGDNPFGPLVDDCPCGRGSTPYRHEKDIKP